MRRVVGLIASALGTFLIVLALFLRFYVADQAVKFPLNENETTSMTAANASYFSTSLLKELSGVTMRLTNTVQGDVASGNSSHAVWSQFTYLYDATNNDQFEYSLQRLAFDRRTGELVNCCGSYVGTDTNLKGATGLAYVWPFNAQKKTYEVYSTSLLKDVPANWTGTATVDGESTYVYVETIPPTETATQSVPGSLVGLKTASVTLGEYTQGVTTEYVDPVTGAPVKATIDEHVFLASNPSTPLLNLLNAHFVDSPASIASAVHTAQKYDTEVSLVEIILPVSLGLLGIILLVIGIILGRRRDTYDSYEEQPEEDYEGGTVQPA
jgi:Porin PorA